MNRPSKLAKPLLGFIVAAIALRASGGAEFIFELSEVTSREWKSDAGKPLRFIKLERPKAGRFPLAIAHYGPTPGETLCFDFYEFRNVNSSTNAHLRLLEHDIGEGRLIKMDFQTNAVEILISVTRKWTNSAGRIIRNQYGYRLNSDKTLSRTTEDFRLLQDERQSRPGK